MPRAVRDGLKKSQLATLEEVRCGSTLTVHRIHANGRIGAPPPLPGAGPRSLDRTDSGPLGLADRNWVFMPEAVEKRVIGGGRRGVFPGRDGRDTGWSISACGLSEAIRS